MVATDAIITGSQCDFAHYAVFRALFVFRPYWHRLGIDLRIPGHSSGLAYEIAAAPGRGVGATQTLEDYDSCDFVEYQVLLLSRPGWHC